MKIINDHIQIEKVKHIDLGAGFTKRGNDCVTIDISSKSSADILMDIGEEKLPFADNQIEMIDCHHTIEHLNGTERIFMMNEAYRVLKPNGKMFISCPHAEASHSYYDPTHKYPPLCENSFDYFSDKKFIEYLQDLYYITARFKILKCERGERKDNWQLLVELSK